MRCVYAEIALLEPRARAVCERAGVELVPVGGDAGTAAWIEDGTLHLDGEAIACRDDLDAIARHLRARACEPADALGAGTSLALAPAVGQHWLAGGAPGEDPLLALELERHPNVRLPEGEAVLYEAVVTTLMERGA